MAVVRVLALLLIFTATVAGFSVEDLKFIGSVPSQKRSISVFEDVNDQGRYYATPLAILDLNSTTCVNDVLTGKVQLVFEVILWSADANNNVYDYVKTYVNSSASFERVGMIRMSKLRVKWKHSSRSWSDRFRLNEDWDSAADFPTSSNFLIECDTLENCSKLRTAMKSQVAVLKGMELEYTRGRGAKVSRMPLTGSHLLSTNTGRRLLKLRPWPANTQYRYLRSEDVTDLIDQTMNAWLSTLPQGSSYSFRDDRAQLESQLTSLLKKEELTSLLFSDRAWESVLWTPTFSRPDKLLYYLNGLLIPDSNPQYFLIDSGRRSASAEGVDELSSTFFGVSIISTNAAVRSGDVQISNGTNRTKIDRRALLERLRPQIDFNGIQFVAKPVKLYRLDFNDLPSRKIISTLDYVKVPNSAIHGIPLRLAASSGLNTEFCKYQAEIMNLTREYQIISARQKNLTTSLHKINNTVVANAFTNQAEFNHLTRLLNKTAEAIKNDVAASIGLNTEFKYQAEIMNLTREYQRLETNLTTSLHKINNTLVANAFTNQAELNNLTRLLNKTAEAIKNDTGVVFTRWGRTVCPEGSDGIYTGYVVASNRKFYGGMGMYMCLTDTPTYHTDGRPSTAYTALYRTEYYSNNGFLTSNAGVSSLTNHDMVCTTCRRSRRSTSVIVWGSKECQTGWYKEYEGTVLSARHAGSASIHKLWSNAICVDGAPEVSPGGQATLGISYAYAVTTLCNSGIPCPPFIASKSVTCAVCSK